MLMERPGRIRPSVSDDLKPVDIREIDRAIESIDIWKPADQRAVLQTLLQGHLFAIDLAPPFWLVTGHVHLGVLSILAIVTGIAIDALSVAGRLRRAISGLYLTGQWLLPFTWWVAFGTGNELLLATLFLWGPCLIIAMLLMAWQAARTGVVGRVPPQSSEVSADN